MGAKLNESPSANWLALQKEINSNPSHRRKKRKLCHETTPEQHLKRGESSSVVSASTQGAPKSAPLVAGPSRGTKNVESVDSLRRMILGELDDLYTDHQKQSGRYVALDCEMVGVGIDGKESSLARVSLVNYYGAILLDEIVKQRERVVDYRTEWSGIRPCDMNNALPFSDVQRRVADLLQGKILVGHAVFNDLKALLLSHPFPSTRDTQQLAYKYKVAKGRHPALRNLIAQEFGIQIHGGEHSSVTDARAAMAVYRRHRREWENGKSLPLPPHEATERSDLARTLKKRKRSAGNGRSTGLSTVVKRLDSSKTKTTSSLASRKKAEWWSELGSSKGSLRIS